MTEEEIFAEMKAETFAAYSDYINQLNSLSFEDLKDYETRTSLAKAYYNSLKCNTKLRAFISKHNNKVLY